MTTEENADFYQLLRERFRKWAESGDGEKNEWAEYLLVAPDIFHLLCKLALDPDVPTAEKAKLAVTIAYFVSPLDLIPEAVVGPVGYVDDIALAALVLNSLISSRPEIVQKHWAGERDVLELVRSILEVADRMVGSGLWKKLKAFLNM